nr:class I SAM-dependent methyltransferase [Antrihabitans stalactiti]
MNRFVDSTPEGGTVLELGSGPGWDADFLESRGLHVRRTDAAAAFRDLQIARGKHVDRLDAIADEYIDTRWPSYDGVMALFVLQHIEREHTDEILRKVAQALRPGGTFLGTVREGIGDIWEGSESGNRYHVTRWEPDAFEARIDAANLEPIWRTRFVDDEGPWLGVIARKDVSS